MSDVNSTIWKGPKSVATRIAKKWGHPHSTLDIATGKVTGLSVGKLRAASKGLAAYGCFDHLDSAELVRQVTDDPG